MCKTRTIASKKHFFHLIINFFVSPLKVPWRSRTLGPLGDLQGTSPGRHVLAGIIFRQVLRFSKVFYINAESMIKFKCQFKCWKYCFHNFFQHLQNFSRVATPPNSHLGQTKFVHCPMQIFLLL